MLRSLPVRECRQHCLDNKMTALPTNLWLLPLYHRQNVAFCLFFSTYFVNMSKILNSKTICFSWRGQESDEYLAALVQF